MLLWGVQGYSGLEAILRSISKAKLISTVTDGLCGGELGSLN